MRTRDTRSNSGPPASSGSRSRRPRRPAVSAEWVTTQILAPGALRFLDDEGRGIVLSAVETGGRPGDLANLWPEDIVLDAPVPYIEVRDKYDPPGKRRRIPLVGVALGVFRKHPEGFPRYRGNDAALRALQSKVRRKLFPVGTHGLYSLRRCFAARLKDGGLESGLVAILLGHECAWQPLGLELSLEWQRYRLLRIALPFDPAIV
ncbi:site-specific integrase [Ensifer adhaerens]|uniref:site-specific integrase n=1 Tax=Ensifer adhaerens TaxID=106592 RepID=UPI00069EED72|nr:site-specific integrase [Ensifer adhaerens]